MTKTIQDSLGQRYELASRERRFFARIVDWIIVLIIYWCVFWYPYNVSYSYFIEYVKDINDNTNMYHLIISAAISFIINYPFLRNGQTIGKRLLNIQVADVHGKVASIWRMYFFREIVYNCAFIIVPYASIGYFFLYASDNGSITGNLIHIMTAVNFLFIFRKDRRCIHDFFAGTIVIKRAS